jgi:hypothetical protein
MLKQSPPPAIATSAQEIEGLKQSLEISQREAGFARLAYDQLVARHEQDIERAKAIPAQGWEQECADGDRILALFPHLQRTEGGWLPVAKIVNEISELAARCKRAEAPLSEKQAGGTAKVPESYKEFAQRAAKNIINSADAQCFRWLLKHHSGSGKAMGGVGMRCWIGGVEFQGDDVATAILEAIDREKPTPSPDGNNGSAT